MADQSSQDRRARTGEDTQRVAYARAPLQVRRGGRTTTSMYWDTNVSKIVARSTSDNSIRCLLPQPFVPVYPMPCPCLCKRSVCACLPFFLCLNRSELSDFCVRSARWACTRTYKRVYACALCDIQRGSARVLLSMWVHAYFFFAICNVHWVLISFGDICLSAYPCSCSYILTIPHLHTLPYYPRTKHPSCPLSQLRVIGGGLPPFKPYDWRAAAPTLLVFVLVATCTMACKDLTPGLAPSPHPCMQPHFTPTSSQPTPLHLIAIFPLAIN